MRIVAFLLLFSTAVLGTTTMPSADARPLTAEPGTRAGLSMASTGLLACGGGGSGSYRKPARPGHGHQMNGTHQSQNQPAARASGSNQAEIQSPNLSSGQGTQITP